MTLDVPLLAGPTPSKMAEYSDGADHAASQHVLGMARAGRRSEFNRILQLIEGGPTCAVFLGDTFVLM